MALLSDNVERAGVAQWLAFALVNLAWAGGQVLGGSGGGGLADATSDARDLRAWSRPCWPRRASWSLARGREAAAPAAGRGRVRR